jgi:hypothetical protein
MNSEPAAAGKGDPETGESVPALLTWNAETLPEPESLTYAKLVVVPSAAGGLPLMQPLNNKKARDASAY